MIMPMRSIQAPAPLTLCTPALAVATLQGRGGPGRERSPVAVKGRSLSAEKKSLRGSFVSWQKVEAPCGRGYGMSGSEEVMHLAPINLPRFTPRCRAAQKGTQPDQRRTESVCDVLARQGEATKEEKAWKKENRVEKRKGCG